MTRPVGPDLCRLIRKPVFGRKSDQKDGKGRSRLIRRDLRQSFQRIKFRGFFVCLKVFDWYQLVLFRFYPKIWHDDHWLKNIYVAKYLCNRKKMVIEYLRASKSTGQYHIKHSENWTSSYSYCSLLIHSKQFRFYLLKKRNEHRFFK